MNLKHRSWQAIFLLMFALFWTALTGLFLASPVASPLAVVLGIPLVIAYSASVCLWQRKAMWIGIGITILLAIAFYAPQIDAYIIGMHISILLLVLGEVGVEFLRKMSRQKAFIWLASLFAGTLGCTWLASRIWITF